MEINLIPIMTNNNLPSGLAEASSMFSTQYQPYMAFDGAAGTTWISALNQYTNQWISYTFSQPVVVNKYTIDASATAGTWAADCNPASFIFQGYSSSWVNLDSRSIPVTTWINSNGHLEFTFQNNVAYSKYRLYINTAYGYNYVQVSNLSMIKVVTDKYLIEQNNQYYSIQSQYYETNAKTFMSLPISGSSPTLAEVDQYGFSNINDISSQITINSETFKPIDKLYGVFKIKRYKFK